MTTFGAPDLAVLLLYMAGVTAWGAWLGRHNKGGSDYFLGSRNLPWWAVMLSVVATETSTLTFLSIPGVAYLGTMAFLQLALGYLLGRIVVARVLLPAYYRGELSAGERFDGPAVVYQEDSTTVVPPDWRAEVDEHANIIMARR